jgi:hypothetical protein
MTVIPEEPSHGSIVTNLMLAEMSNLIKKRFYYISTNMKTRYGMQQPF